MIGTGWTVMWCSYNYTQLYTQLYTTPNAPYLHPHTLNSYIKFSMIISCLIFINRFFLCPISLLPIHSWQAGLMWSKKHCDNQPNTDLKEVIGNFLEFIHFYKIPANILMKEIHPLGLVPYHIIMNALAYQVSLFSQSLQIDSRVTWINISVVGHESFPGN